MKSAALFLLSCLLTSFSIAQQGGDRVPENGYEERIRQHIDTLTVFDTHEHFLDPELIREAAFLDFALLFLENGYHDMVTAGMPDTLFNMVFSHQLSPAEKWKLIRPWWEKSKNTANNRVILKSIKTLYNADDLDAVTVSGISTGMKGHYGREWFTKVIKEYSRIDYVIMDGKRLSSSPDFVRYAERFDPWISVRAKSTIDSLAIMQADPIYTLEGFVKSMNTAFENLAREGMVAVKIDQAYIRSIRFDKTATDAARKIFRSLINGNEDTRITPGNAKPLQDYMVWQLIAIARKHNMPVAFHTGIQAGNKNRISNSDPLLLTDLFMNFPDVKFVLFHGSYPYGGELSVLAKTFPNVFIDMNWTFDISPAYAARYLDEWLETVPANKIMVFGGDQRLAELTYGSVVVARDVVADVLIRKVSDGYFTEEEAKSIAKMILHDNGMEFYGIK